MGSQARVDWPACAMAPSLLRRAAAEWSAPRVQVIKGNWQLSGGHKGDRADDRTAGASAVQDFDAFVQAGITTFDTADIYGPSEGLIGDYLRRRPRGAEGLQILTKCCKFGSDMTTISQQSVSQARPHCGSARTCGAALVQWSARHDFARSLIGNESLHLTQRDMRCRALAARSSASACPRWTSCSSTGTTTACAGMWRRRST